MARGKRVLRFVVSGALMTGPLAAGCDDDPDYTINEPAEAYPPADLVTNNEPPPAELIRNNEATEHETQKDEPHIRPPVNEPMEAPSMEPPTPTNLPLPSPSEQEPSEESPE